MTTILTVDILKTIAPITSALANQHDMILPFVEVSETLYLKDVLGDALYTDIITSIENGVLSGHNQTLVESYLYNMSAWYTFYESSIFIMFRAEAKGITKKHSENSESLDKSELAIYRQSILEKATYWRNATIAYLSKNYLLYPLWRCTEDNPLDKSNDYSNGIYL